MSHIGAPGKQGFGVGICPSPPVTFAPLTGYADPAHDNYGNYQHSDSSIMVWIPAFYYRINDARNPTYAGHGVNSIDVQPYSAFTNVAAANAAGYALHRAFYDGGAIQPGVFVDKYQCSNNGGVASSIKLGNPLSTHATDHNPIGALNGTPASNLGGTFAAAKTRGEDFFPATQFIRSALALLALAHGQAATTNAWCAWYDAAGTTNFPKGNNNNALTDSNDVTCKFVSDGYPNAAKSGSATQLSKTTHNGQACGVADLNGNIWEVSPGITCLSGTANITAATKTNPVQITVTGHGRSTGEVLQIESVGGMTELNDKTYAITVVDPNNLTLDGVNGTAFSTYTSGGLIRHGQHYVLKTSARAADLTGGNTLTTDAFGATGVAAHSDPIAMTFRTDYAQNGSDKRFGRGANQVLDAATSGAGWVCTGLALPLAVGISDGTSGSNLFGADYFYQRVQYELCLLAGGDWSGSSYAGVWALHFWNSRTNTSTASGFRAALYL